ncbi:hypothetical protein G9A89_009774 [Geosiphon pyriformis]|nr:hypothetical protein G9A89_009774 [Geosiphon pyriformis]
MERDERIVLNIGGRKYETYRSTLTAYPGTLLGTMFQARNQELLHPENLNEYFFDRNGDAFHYVLEYYRTGQILWQPPPEVPTPSSSSSSSPSVSYTELQQELVYFQIPIPENQIEIAHKAGGELLDEFAYALKDLICAAIGKLIDRLAITFYRDGSPMECAIAINGDEKLRKFSKNGYCIVNYFCEDLKKYLESVFPRMLMKLDWGANYKSLTLDMINFFTRSEIQKYSKIGRLLAGSTGNRPTAAPVSFVDGNSNQINGRTSPNGSGRNISATTNSSKSNADKDN